jgi:hypothetical protein
MSFYRVNEYRIYPRGKRGSVITISNTVLRDLGVKPGQSLSVYRRPSHGGDSQRRHAGTAGGGGISGQFFMKAPQIIWLCITSANLLITAYLHGNPKIEQHNIFVSLIVSAIELFLLWWGGKLQRGPLSGGERKFNWTEYNGGSVAGHAHDTGPRSIFP